jgi:hypothetical protein
MKPDLPRLPRLAWLMACITGPAMLAVPTAHAEAPPAPPLSWRCPARLPVRSTPLGVDSLPPGAQASLADGPVSLSGFSAFDGPPQEGAALRPTSTLDGGQRVHWTWDDAPLRSVWLSCDYAGGLIHLAWPVQQPLRGCTAAQRVLASGVGRPKAWQVSWRCEVAPAPPGDTPH